MLGDLLVFCAWAGGIVGPPTVAYVIAERLGRRRWPPMPGPRAPVGAGAYRRTTVDGIEEPGRAPKLVRLAAFASFALGQFVLPGYVIAFAGLFMLGAGLLAIPSLIVGTRILSLGFDLLRNRPGTAERARTVAASARRLNLWIMVGLTLLAAVLFYRRPSDDAFWVPLAALLFCLLSLGHARLLRAAADQLDTAPDARSAT